jgi:hypothetical protein
MLLKNISLHCITEPGPLTRQNAFVPPSTKPHQSRARQRAVCWPLFFLLTAVEEEVVVEEEAVDSDRAYRLRLCQSRRLSSEPTSRPERAGG